MNWIKCEDAMPAQHDSVFKKFYGTDKWHDAMFQQTSYTVLVTISFKDGVRAVTTGKLLDGKWKIDVNVENTVIAWAKMPEPYMEDKKV